MGCLTLLLSLYVVSQDRPATVNEDVFPAERAVLSARNEIQSGSAVIQSVHYRDQGDGLKIQSRASYSIWFSDDKIRTDHKTWSADDASNDGALVLDQRAAQVGSIARIFDTDPMEPARRVASSEFKLTDPKVLDQTTKLIYDIRKAGMSPKPFSILYSQTPKDFVGSWAGLRLQPTITEKHDERGKVTTIAFRTQPGLAYEMDIGMDCGPNLLRGVIVQGTTKYSLSCEISEFPSARPAGKRWFPKSIIYLAEDNGNAWEKNEVTISEASFDQEIPNKTFDWDGLGTPPGTLIIQRSPNERSFKIYDGKGLQPFKPARADLGNHKPVYASRSAFLFWRIGIGCALIAIVFLFLSASRWRGALAKS